MSAEPLLDDDYDPFEAFERANGGQVRDPYPDLAELRRTTPVLKVDLWELMGLDAQGDHAQAGPQDLYTLFRHDDVCAVLRDGETFSSSGYEEIMGPVMGHSILEMDEPEHHRYRALVAQAFTRKAMDRWEGELIRPVVNEHIDAFAARGRADLVRELTFPFPVTVIAGMLGLPRDDLMWFHRRAVELINWGFDSQRGKGASTALYDYFKSIIDQRRAQPREDVVSVLTQAELEGHSLSDDDIIAFLRLLLPAGAETTSRSSANLLFGLLTHADQLDALRRDRSLMPQAIEEGLRWEPPLLGIQRTATRDVEIGGVLIPAGSAVALSIGAANRDETRYPDPDRFDMSRAPQQHMAFAFGPHMCLGMHLARMETTVAVNALLDRLPGLRLDPEADDPHIAGMVFRSPTSLPVLFDAV